MSDHESERQIEQLIDTHEVSRYQEVFEDFYRRQSDVLEAIGMVYFDPRQPQWKDQLTQSVMTIRHSFKRCISQIVETASKPDEVACDVADFIVDSEAMRHTQTAMLMPGVMGNYQTYNKEELYMKVHELFLNSTSQVTMTEDLAVIYCNGLHTDLQRMLADIDQLSPTTGV